MNFKNFKREREGEGKRDRYRQKHTETETGTARERERERKRQREKQKSKGNKIITKTVKGKAMLQVDAMHTPGLCEFASPQWSVNPL